MGYYPFSMCSSECSHDFCACHQLICCIWFIQPWLEIVIYSHTFGNSLTSFWQFPFQSCLNRWGCGISSFLHPTDYPCYAYVFTRTSPFCRKAFKKERENDPKMHTSWSWSVIISGRLTKKLKLKPPHYNLKNSLKKKNPPPSFHFKEYFLK